MTEMINKTKLEKIADDFIDNSLKDTPEMIYHLYVSLEEYIQEQQQLNMSKHEILMEHYKIKGCEGRAIIDEDFYGKASEIDESNMLLYFESMPDRFIKELTILVMTSDKV